MEKVFVGSWDRLQGGNIGGHEPLTMEVWQSRGVLSGACSISLAAPSRRASRGKRLRWLRAGSSSCDAGWMESVSASRRESRVHVASAVGRFRDRDLEAWPMQDRTERALHAARPAALIRSAPFGLPMRVSPWAFAGRPQGARDSGHVLPGVPSKEPQLSHCSTQASNMAGPCLLPSPKI